MKKMIVYIIIGIVLFSLFSYKLIEVPRGLTIDESAFGYNAVLLSNTLRDENQRFLPVFVLSINGTDWRQPVMQYYLTFLFKLFGPSVYLLRLASVIITILTALLLYYLVQKLKNSNLALISLLFFITTPIIMIHSHMGLDNIAVLPFTLAWLIGIYHFQKERDYKYLILSAISLGIGFYAHKSMRSFSTGWIALTLVYIGTDYFKSLNFSTIKKRIKPLIIFSVFAAPFYLIVPYLEFKYAGAVLGSTDAKIDSVYKFMHSYLASFDPSFLFVKGDELPHHSTGVHGMLLLASLPAFLVGIPRMIKKRGFHLLILISFFVGPLILGFPGSVHRASRLIALVPSYSIISAFGIHYLFKGRVVYRVFASAVLILILINYFDFTKYYWNSYADDTYHLFYETRDEKAYKYLHKESQSRKLVPYMMYSEAESEETTQAFMRSIYFPEPLAFIQKVGDLPKNGMLMTHNSKVEGLNKLDTEIAGYLFYTN